MAKPLLPAKCPKPPQISPSFPSSPQISQNKTCYATLVELGGYWEGGFRYSPKIPVSIILDIAVFEISEFENTFDILVILGYTIVLVLKYKENLWNYQIIFIMTPVSLLVLEIKLLGAALS